MNKKEEKVTIDFVTESGKKFCTVKFPKAEWEVITQLALTRFVNDAVQAYLDEYNNSSTKSNL